MADVQLFGMNPLGHHLISVLLHACNVVLLFFILRKATGCLIRSAVVAGLFAVHPLNVENVAWVAERKFRAFHVFFASGVVGIWVVRKEQGDWPIRTCGCPVRGRARRQADGRHSFPSCCCCGIYWPLRRIGSESDSSSEHFLPSLVAEKVPLFALAAASSWITLHAQRSGGALGSAELLPLAARVENAIYSYYPHTSPRGFGRRDWRSSTRIRKTRWPYGECWLPRYSL